MSSLVATVLELTDQVQAAIGDGDWARAQELEDANVGTLLEQLAGAADGSDLKPTLLALEERNRGLIGLVEHHKRRIVREAAVARSGHEGTAAYADVRRSTVFGDCIAPATDGLQGRYNGETLASHSKLRATAHSFRARSIT